MLERRRRSALHGDHFICRKSQFHSVSDSLAALVNLLSDIIIQITDVIRGALTTFVNDATTLACVGSLLTLNARRQSLPARRAASYLSI